jgi:hypothetical protein
LLDNGAHINAIEAKHGYTALHCAVIGEHINCVHILLQSGANRYLKTTSGKTVFHLSAELGIYKCLRELLYGFDTNLYSIDEKDNNGHTPLHLSCIDGNYECINMLLQSSADPYIIDSHGRNCIEILHNIGKDNLILLIEKYTNEKISKPELFDGMNIVHAKNILVPSDGLFEGMEVYINSDKEIEGNKIVNNVIDERRWIAMQNGKFLADSILHSSVCTVPVFESRYMCALWARDWRNKQCQVSSSDLLSRYELFKNKIINSTTTISDDSYINANISTDNIISNSITNIIYKMKSLLHLNDNNNECSDRNNEIDINKELYISTKDDLSTIYIAKIDIEKWELFCANIPYRYHHNDDDDTQLMAYKQLQVRNMNKNSNNSSSNVQNLTEIDNLQFAARCLRQEVYIMYNYILLSTSINI